MNSILERIKQNNSGSNDAAAWLDFTRRVEKEVSAEASKDITNLKNMLATAELRAVKAEAEMHAMQAERDAARDAVAGYEAKITEMQEHLTEADGRVKQAISQIELEQRTALELRDRHETTTGDLQRQLVAEKERFNSLVAENASMKTKLKSKPAPTAPKPTPASTPAPVDLSDLEFEVGDIIRGPNGIAGAKIRLSRGNS